MLFFLNAIPEQGLLFCGGSLAGYIPVKYFFKMGICHTWMYITT